MEKQLKEERFILTSYKDREVAPTQFSKKNGLDLLMGIVKPGPFWAQEFDSKAGACSPPELLHSPFGEDTHLNLTTR